MVTGTDNVTCYYEGSVQVYPCRCGKTHRGDYAFEDWRHHNCFHETMVEIGVGQCICRDCGAVFTLERVKV